MEEFDRAERQRRLIPEARALLLMLLDVLLFFKMRSLASEYSLPPAIFCDSSEGFFFRMWRVTCMLYFLPPNRPSNFFHLFLSPTFRYSTANPNPCFFISYNSDVSSLPSPFFMLAAR